MNVQTETRAAHPNVHAALAAAQSEMKPPEKNAENPAFKKDGKAMKYADLSSVVESVRAPLTRHGLTWGWRSRFMDSGMWVWTAYIAHGDSGTEVCCDVPVNSGTGNNHAFKSAVTYAKRIGIESVTGQAPGDDDDGNAAAAAAPREDRRPPAHRPDPSHNGPAPADIAIASLTNAANVAQLAAIWGDLPVSVKALPEVIGAKDNRKAELNKPADDLAGDSIPY